MTQKVITDTKKTVPTKTSKEVVDRKEVSDIQRLYDKAMSMPGRFAATIEYKDSSEKNAIIRELQTLAGSKEVVLGVEKCTINLPDYIKKIFKFRLVK